MKNSISIKVLLLMSGLIYSMFGYSQTILYEADNTSNFPNPERGFTPSIDPSWPSNITWQFMSCDGYNYSDWTRPLNAVELKSWRNKGYSVVQVRYHTDEFRNKDFTQEFLDRLNDDFAVARQEGFKVIPRFTYNWPLGGPDASQSQILTHIDQLKPFFEDNVDVLHMLEHGFIGMWGETHTSCNGLVDGSEPNNLTWPIVEKLFGVVPKERMIALRYPKWKFIYFNDSHASVKPLTEEEAYTGTIKSRWAQYDDCPVCGEWNLGTWQTNEQNAQKVINYLEVDNRYVFQGGESGDPDTSGSAGDGDFDGDGWNYGEFDNCDRVLWQFEKMRWSTINANYGNNFGFEAASTWAKEGCYDEIERRLGYRYRLIEANIPSTLAPGNNLSMKFKINNDGWSSVHNPRMLEVILRSKITNKLTKLVLADGQSIPEDHSHDPRFWQSDDPVEVRLQKKLPDDLPDGEYDVFLNLADPLLYDRPEYSIRLANRELWEDSTGFNSMKHVLTIDKDFVLSARDMAIDNIFIQPNPVEGVLSIRGLTNGVCQFTIHDTTGKSWISSEMRTSSKNAIDVTSLSAGIYIININTQEGSLKSMKFIKE